jgi:hypothetical protein
VVEGLSCYLPMRFISIAKPHVHHERISVVGAFDPSRARLWFQSHRDKSHFPNCPMVAKNLRLEGTSAFRSSRIVRIAPGTQSKRPGFVPRSTQSLPPAGPQDSFSGAAAALSSLSAPRATILSASPGNGRCNAFASSHGARIQTSHSSSVVRITGMALGWIGSTTAFGEVVRKP